jgi:uncharacterized BrkB/YihY/UPF0761 family membrane protein
MNAFGAPVFVALVTVLALGCWIWVSQERRHPIARILLGLVVASALLSLLRWVTPQTTAYSDGCEYAGWLWWLVGCWS